MKTTRIFILEKKKYKKKALTFPPSWKSSTQPVLLTCLIFDIISSSVPLPTISQQSSSAERQLGLCSRAV